MLTSAAELLHLVQPPFTFHMDAAGAKESLADALWSGQWIESVASRFEMANPALKFLFEQQTLGESDSRFAEVQGQSRWEAVMAALFRARSIRLVPIETAAMSIMWLYYRVPHSLSGVPQRI